MSGVEVILVGIALLFLSGLPGCMLPARSSAGQRIASALMAAGSLLGLCGLAAASGEAAQSLSLPWPLPWGRFAVAVDPISILFLAPVLVVPALGSFYGWGYWKPSEHPRSARRLGLSFGFLAGSMALVVIARDGVLFLIAWESMALSAYFAATAEEDDPEVRQAGWIYLIATHMGTLCLFAMFALWRSATGTFALAPAPGLSPDTAGTLFLLALAGFGFKAGLMPLHVWLPGAHANAPSHVSAVMSGVMLKMGIYGIVRMTGLLPVEPLWWGGVLLGAGGLSAVAGIVFALCQRDMKRLLAYSSIENIGIIAMGLGLALLGRALARPDWIMLGMGGALLHVWNHSLFKPLLFFSAGAVIHAAGTRDIERLGGLAKRMPRAALLFCIGALAICALPPLNGFASEWLLYLGFLHALDPAAGRPGAAVAVGAVVLATVGAIAVACFVKLLGTVFLGSARSGAASGAHDPQPSMLLPMGALAAGCAFLGLFPTAAAAVLDNAARTWAALDGPAGSTLAGLAPLSSVSLMGLLLLGTVGAVALPLRKLLRTRPIRTSSTWDCGYAAASARIQYTGSSFVQTVVRLFRFIIFPRYGSPSLGRLFPAPGRFKSTVADIVLDRVAMPAFQSSGRWFSALRVMQQGQTHLYLAYILIILFILLLWGSV